MSGCRANETSEELPGPDGKTDGALTAGILQVAGFPGNLTYRYRPLLPRGQVPCQSAAVTAVDRRCHGTGEQNLSSTGSKFGPEPRIFWHEPADGLKGLCAACREVVTKVTHLIAERNIVQHPTLEVNSQRDANSPFLQPENATGPGKTRSEVEVAPEAPPQGATPWSHALLLAHCGLVAADALNVCAAHVTHSSLAAQLMQCDDPLCAHHHDHMLC